MKLCAVLIASRGRHERLLKTIKSVLATSSPENVEIVLRLDGDDMATIGVVPLIYSMSPETRVLVGPRKRGYDSLPEFYTEMAAHCQAKWIVGMNDDITFEGEPGWDEQLKAIPTTGVLVEPEFLQNNLSRYGSGSCCVLPFVPNGCWRAFGNPTIREPMDTWLRQVLVGNNGWRVELLRGMWANHQRDEAKLADQGKG